MLVRCGEMRTLARVAYAGGVASVIRAFDSTQSVAKRVLSTNVLSCYGLAPKVHCAAGS